MRTVPFPSMPWPRSTTPDMLRRRLPEISWRPLKSRTAPRKPFCTEWEVRDIIYCEFEFWRCCRPSSVRQRRAPAGQGWIGLPPAYRSGRNPECDCLEDRRRRLACPRADADDWLLFGRSGVDRKAPTSKHQGSRKRPTSELEFAPT